MPSYATHAPQGYCGDWKRGAPMGRPTIGPDARPLAEIEADFIEACTNQDRALRLKENRPADGFKASAWEAAAQHWADERARLRADYNAAKARAAATPAQSPKITLRRVRLDSGGYDECGAYWGCGAPLYWAASDTAGVEYDSTFRASDRDDAKAHVRQTFPNARFYR